MDTYTSAGTSSLLSEHPCGGSVTPARATHRSGDGGPCPNRIAPSTELLAILRGPRGRRRADEDEAPGQLCCIGGNNGATVLAGLHANNMKLTWEGAKKQCTVINAAVITQTRAMRREGLAPFKRALRVGYPANA